MSVIVEVSGPLGDVGLSEFLFLRRGGGTRFGGEELRLVGELPVGSASEFVATGVGLFSLVGLPLLFRSAVLRRGGGTRRAGDWRRSSRDSIAKSYCYCTKLNKL